MANKTWFYRKRLFLFFKRILARKMHISGRTKLFYTEKGILCRGNVSFLALMGRLSKSNFDRFLRKEICYLLFLSYFSPWWNMEALRLVATLSVEAVREKEFMPVVENLPPPPPMDAAAALVTAAGEDTLLLLAWTRDAAVRDSWGRKGQMVKENWRYGLELPEFKLCKHCTRYKKRIEEKWLY